MEVLTSVSPHMLPTGLTWCDPGEHVTWAGTEGRSSRSG
jgi:hypothetical protein